MNGAYTRTAVAFHWTTAGLVFAAALLGVYMHDLPFSPMKLKLYSYHKWTGVTIFIVAALRLFWRATHPAPELPASMAAWERAAAKGAHAALYLLLFSVPAAGWLMSSAHGFQTVYLGVVPIPDLVAKDKALAEALEGVHALLNLALFALVALHAAAALKHHFLDRDDVLRRMLAWRRP